MLLKFPNLETLRQALDRQIIPPTVSQTAVKAGSDAQDQVWVETPASLNRTVQSELRKLSVQLPKNCSLTLKSYPSWTDLADSQRYLVFDDPNTFRQALTGKPPIVPRDISQAAVTAGFDEQDRLWIETPTGLGPSSVPRAAQAGHALWSALRGPDADRGVVLARTAGPGSGPQFDRASGADAGPI